MPRYIDADALINDFDQTFLGNNARGVIRAVIDDAPTADVVERKVGKWIDEPVFRQTMDGKIWVGYTYCSECKELYEFGYRSKFCQNCGARMNE